LDWQARKARAFDWSHEVALIDGATVTITVAHKARAAMRLAFRPMAAWPSDAGRVEGGAAGPDDDGLRQVVRCYMLARPGSDREICKPASAAVMSHSPLRITFPVVQLTCELARPAFRTKFCSR
jgi:hypothetical protein